VLNGLRNRFAEKAEALLDELIERRRFDAIADCAEAYPLRVFPDAIGMSEDDGAKLVRALLQAGLDTTVNSLGATFHCLSRFPDQWRRLIVR
jgi:cytochrome P450